MVLEEPFSIKQLEVFGGLLATITHLGFSAFKRFQRKILMMQYASKDLKCLQNNPGYTDFVIYQLEKTKIQILQTGEEIRTTFHILVDNWIHCTSTLIFSGRFHEQSYMLGS